MSGFSFGQSGLLSRLKSPRALVGIAVIGAGLAGGWYYFTNSSPQTASAMTKPVPAAGAKSSPPARHAVATSQPISVTPAPTAAPAIAPLSTSSQTVVVQEVDPLGATYVDKANGFSIRFPAAWAIRSFNADPWVLDCGNASVGMISIGFSPCPKDLKADQLLPESIARRIKRRSGTTMSGQGKTIIAGKKALWFKSTGPLPLSNGSPKMTKVQYIVPLGDGRVMEIRVAAPPEQFPFVGGMMKESVDTFTLVPRK
jgi:hypothetical protein